MVALGAACASTQVADSWVSPSITQDFKPQKVLVAAIVPGSNRTQMEKEMIAQLGARGITAVASEEFFANGSEVTREQVEQVVQANGFDSVLVSSYKGMEQDTHYEPDMTYGAFVGTYYGGWAGYSRGAYRTTESAIVETNLFDAKGEGEKVWSATTSTFEPDNAAKEIPQLVETIVLRMEKDGVT